MLYHYTFRGHAADDMSILSFPHLGEFFKYGYLGVDLFFMISGWVIVMSINDSTLLKFVKSRCTRLYPAYWFCLVATAVVIMLWGAPRYSIGFTQLVINATMLNGVIGVPHVDGVYWSLLIELKFYGLIALFILARRYWKLTINHFIWLWLCITILLICLSAYDHITLKVINYINITRYSAYFIAGMLFYQIFQRGFRVQYLIGVLFCFGVSVYQAIIHIPIIESHYNATFSPITLSLILVVFYVGLLLASLRLTSSLYSKYWFHLGTLTYPLYLIHQNIGYIIFNNISNGLNKYILLILVVLAMVGASYIIYLYIERPIRKKLKAWIN